MTYIKKHLLTSPANVVPFPCHNDQVLAQRSSAGNAAAAVHKEALLFDAAAWCKIVATL
jgi:hypothetical protein